MLMCIFVYRCKSSLNQRQPQNCQLEVVQNKSFSPESSISRITGFAHHGREQFLYFGLYTFHLSPANIRTICFLYYVEMHVLLTWAEERLSKMKEQNFWSVNLWGLLSLKGPFSQTDSATVWFLEKVKVFHWQFGPESRVQSSTHFSVLIIFWHPANQKYTGVFWRDDSSTREGIAMSQKG